MTINQIRYFIAAAKCLNFTKAADQLYIAQPTLSRQINAMETELNMQLFVRAQRHVRLTPAGRVLLDSLEGINELYAQGVAKAENAQYGMSGEIRIGILDGARVNDLFPPVIGRFAEAYPNIEVSLRHFSFNGLVEKVYDGSLDLAVTLYFDIEKRTNLMFGVIEKTRDHIVVLKDHPMAGRKYASLSEFRDETFIVVACEDSDISAKLIIEACKAQNFTPKVRYSPSIQTSMLWLQCGLGVAILDTRNLLYHSADVCFLETDVISDPSLTLIWSQDNANPFAEYFAKALLAQNKPGKL